jgi:hypothetical protein
MDTYTKIILTVIAICLIFLAVQGQAVVRAKSSLSCTGELNANAWGGVEATLGGYTISLRCDD